MKVNRISRRRLALLMHLSLMAFLCVSVSCSKATEASRPSLPFAESSSPQISTADKRPKELSYVQLLSKEHWVVADFRSLWETQDGGTVWKEVVKGFDGQGNGKHTGGLSFISAKSGYGVVASRLLRTEDGAASWKLVSNLNFNASSIHFVDATNGWAVGAISSVSSQDSGKLFNIGRIWRTTDGGLEWQAVPAQSISIPNVPTDWVLKDISFSGAQDGWAVGRGVLLHSADGGVQWNDLNIEGDFSRITFANADLGWAIHRDFAMFELTVDGGRTWKHVEMRLQNNELRLLFLTPDRAISIQGTNELLSSNDGGKEWQTVDLPRDSESLLKRATYFDDTYVGRAFDGTLVAIWLIGGTSGTVSATSMDDGRSWK